MPDLSLSLTYAPITGSITTDDVSSLMQRLEGAYQAAAVAPHVGLDRSREVWARAERRQPTSSPIAEARRLIGEIEYLGRALAREEDEPSRFAYDIAIRQMLDELDRGRLAGGLQRDLPHMECLRLRMESPLAILLGVPDAFVYVGGLTGVGALLALIEKQANVFGRIKLERETLKLQQTKLIFEREQLEEQQHAWREALDAAAAAGTDRDGEAGAVVQLDGPFKLETGHLDQIRHGLRIDELDA